MHVMIIGAGASGLMAAITAAEAGAEVTILECANKPARKIYATGNGKCNFTNQNMDSGFYRSRDVSLRLVKAALGRFDQTRTIAFFRSLGMLVKERGGYCYPATGQASTVAEILVRRCEMLGVTILCDTKVTGISKMRKGFKVTGVHSVVKEKKVVGQTDVCYEADKVIVAVGTTAGGFGCEITGKELLKPFQVPFVPVVASLSALKCSEKQFFKTVAGVRVDAAVTITDAAGKSILAREQGELQLTDYGISGIPVFQVSRFAAYALQEGRMIKAYLDFLPEYTYDMLWNVYEQSRRNYGSLSVAQVFSYMFHEKLSYAILQELGLNPQESANTLSPKLIKKIIGAWKHFGVTPVESMPIKNAQVCAGGVDTGVLNDKFMITKVPGLYVTGELVDVDGICGGYNLQFAWSSGRIAGMDAVEDRDAVY